MSKSEVDKASSLIDFLTYLLLEDATLVETFSAYKMSIPEKDQDILKDCIELYAEQLFLSDFKSPNRGYAAVLYRFSESIATGLVESSWDRDTVNLAAKLKLLEKNKPSFWLTILEYYIAKPPGNLKSKLDRLSKNNKNEVQDNSKTPLPDPYGSLRKYLRNETIYGPFLKNMWKKLKIKPSVEIPGLFIKEDSSKSVGTSKSVNATKPVNATKFVDATKSVDATGPADGKAHSSKTKSRHVSSTKPAVEDPHGRGRRQWSIERWLVSTDNE
ncbi:hypothetical protein MMC18_006480 [Xylographa bjoerkii]|nr:hypothetical protein [Xylographa bjoerkii]